MPAGSIKRFFEAIAEVFIKVFGTIAILLLLLIALLPFGVYYAIATPIVRAWLFKKLNKQGRTTNWKAVEPLLQASNGTLIFEKGAAPFRERVWWTRDDLVAASPTRLPIRVTPVHRMKGYPGKWRFNGDTEQVMGYAEQIIDEQLAMEHGRAKLISGCWGLSDRLAEEVPASDQWDIVTVLRWPDCGDRPALALGLPYDILPGPPEWSGEVRRPNPRAQSSRHYGTTQ